MRKLSLVAILSLLAAVALAAPGEGKKGGGGVSSRKRGGYDASGRRVNKLSVETNDEQVSGDYVKGAMGAVKTTGK